MVCVQWFPFSCQKNLFKSIFMSNYTPKKDQSCKPWFLVPQEPTCSQCEWALNLNFSKNQQDMQLTPGGEGNQSFCPMPTVGPTWIPCTWAQCGALSIQEQPHTFIYTTMEFHFTLSNQAKKVALPKDFQVVDIQAWERYPWKEHHQKAKASPILDPSLFVQSPPLNSALTSTPDIRKTIQLIWQDPAEAVFVGISSVRTEAQWTTIAAWTCK